MAIAFARAVAVGSSTDAASYATASWTPATGKAHLASVTNRYVGTSSVPTLSGNDLTWVLIDTQLANPVRTTTFYAVGAASPSAGALTADMAGQTQLSCVVQVDELTGVNDAAPINAANVQKAQASASSLATAALTAVAAGGAIWAGCGVQLNESEPQIAGTNYTSLGTTGATTPSIGQCTIYDADGADVTPDFNSATPAQRCMVAVEVVAAVVASSGRANRTGMLGFF